MMTDKQKKIGLGLIILILCAIAYYFLYFIKTPAYSIKIIQESIQKHDVATFEKHVDLDTLYNKGFDDFIAAQAKLSQDDILNNPFAMGFIQMMKPGVVAQLKAETIADVKGENTDNNTANTEQKQMAKNIEEKANVKGLDIRDISVISKENGSADVAITIHHYKLDKNFDIKVKMNQLDDGTWKLKEITNLTSFIIEVENATKAKLAELNKPIKEKLSKSVILANGRMSLSTDNNPFFASHWLEIDTKLQNQTDKDISSINFNIILTGPNQENLLTKAFTAKGQVSPNNIISRYYKVDLNPFIEKDAAIIKSDFPKTSWNIEVTAVEYADGTKLEYLTELPDPKKN